MSYPNLFPGIAPAGQGYPPLIPPEVADGNGAAIAQCNDADSTVEAAITGSFLSQVSRTDWTPTLPAGWCSGSAPTRRQP
jgi:hypothetical protein